jgi:biopolymer transport protein ExbD
MQGMSAPVLSDESDHGFQIAPMVDVVFVLLLFFMALAGLRQVEQHMVVAVPQKGGDAELPIVVDISARGAVACNGLELTADHERSFERLEAWCKKVAAVTAETPIVMRPDSRVEHERFVQVLAVLHRTGLRKISFH